MYEFLTDYRAFHLIFSHMMLQFKIAESEPQYIPFFFKRGKPLQFTAMKLSGCVDMLQNSVSIKVHGQTQQADFIIIQ
jgi:hypothetical protein